MKKIFFLVLLLITIGCSRHDDISRHGFGDNIEAGNGSDNGQGNDDAPADIPDAPFDLPDDNNQRADTVTRGSACGTEYRYGAPGILYLLEDEGNTATLRDITTGGSIKLRVSTKILELNDTIVASSLMPIKEDTVAGKVWYHGKTIKGGEPVYFVYERMK